MKKTKFFILLVLSFSLSLQAFRVYQSSKKETMPYTISPKSSYEKEWKRVDSLQQKGLTKSALEIVVAIYSKSKNEKNTNHFIRAIIEKMKLESYVEEDSYIKAIGDLEKDAASTSFPIKNIIHSVAAETYWKYYQNNRYNFLNRTETVNFENSDIRTWDLKKLLEKVSSNYQLSLKDEQKLKLETLTNYEGILIKGAGSDNLRPTLFDFLGHRAVDFFKDEEPELTKPAYAFELDKASYFSNHSAFTTLAISSPDSTAMKLWALKLLQQLILFHSSDKNPQALIDADIKRLQFVKQYSTLTEKDSLYLQALVLLEKEFSTSPFSAEAGYLIASYFWEKSNTSTEQTAGLKKLAYQKCNAVIAAFPAEQSAKNCTYLKSLISEKSLSITVEDALLPDVANLVFVKYKNVKKVYFKVVKLDDSNEFDLDRGISNEIQRALLTKKGEASWSLELPDDGDFMEHGVQVKLTDLKKGHYILFAGSDASFSSSKEGLAHTNFWITTLSYITQKNTNGSYDGYTLDRKTGMPLKNVRLQLWSENYDYSGRKYNFIKGASFTSNEKGFFTIPFVDNNRNFYIEFTGAEQDRLCSDYGFYQYRNNEGFESSYRQTLFFTDRKIYRPGQTVFFKGILLEKIGNETKILPKQTTEVIFYDVNGQKISSLNLTSNAYGTINGSFVAPQGLLNGQMQITDGSGSTYFSVEEYKRPKFEVIFDPLTGSYLLGDSVVISGKAQSYSGAVVDGAQVKYRVVREAIFPYWWAYWRSNIPNSPAMEISSGVLSTNSEGVYTVRFKSIPDLKLEKNNSTSFNYTVYVDVTDINGETHSANKSVRIGYTKLTLTTNIPKTIDKNENQNFKISSSNLNGDYVKAQGTVKVYRLKQPTKIFRERKWPKPDRFVMSQTEFELLYENDIYEDENNKYKWEKEEKVAEFAFNTDTSLSKKAGELNFENMKRWKQGEYMWIASTTDKDQPEITSQDYFTLGSKEEKTIPTSSFNYFTMLVSKGEPGEIAKALIGTKEKNVQVLFEIERENEITKSEWFLLNEEQKIIEIPIEEKDRGNFAVHFTFVKNNRAYKNDATITVPYTNKELDIAFETFRNKLYPGQAEEWRIKIKDRKGVNVAAELLATLYDASLDAFAPNEWLMNLYQNYYSKISWEVNNSFKVNSAAAYGKDWNIYGHPNYRTYDELNWFGFEGYSYFGYGHSGIVLQDSYSAAPMTMQADEGRVEKAMPRASAELKEESNKLTNIEQASSGSKNERLANDKSSSQSSGGPTQIRKNFNETAFFFPSIETNEQGELIIKFTVPEALTRWKMLGLAHTKDLQVGSIEKELVTQKDLMVSLNAPRFFREGDKITLLAKVTNLSDKNLSGLGQLHLFNSITMQEITKDLIPKNKSVSFDVAKGQSKTLSWDLEIPFGIEAITYRVKAQSDAFSDGEEMTVPVLTNRMLVTESLPLPIRGNEAKKFSFNKLLSQNEHSKTLSNYKVTLEFTSNPAWYAIQSLPYLMEYPYACAEQTFSRYYANSIATHVANSSPKIKAVFDAWKSNATANNKESLLSNLEKNAELKSLLLEETPWVMQAKNESERKQRVGLLFDLNKMSYELDNALKQLIKMQTPNGGWPWFEGMPDDAFITQYIVTGMGHLDKLGVKNIRQDKACFDVIRKAVLYMDDRMRENYDWLVKHQGINLMGNQLNYNSIHYLYARSYFKDIEMAKKNQVAFDYYKAQSEKYWLSQSKYMQGMIALALNRYNNKLIAMDIIKSLKENSISNDELGMYWKENANGFYWYQAPIETQALLIEAFDEVAKDSKSVESMKIWLLKNKQTNDWKTTKATSEACYALLLRGNDWLATEPNVEINIGERIVNPLKNPDLKTEAGTGYFKTSWNGEEITPSMGTILVSPLKNSGKEEKVMWGAVYWQYFENLDKITSNETPLHLSKKIFLEQNSATGPVITPVDSASNLKIGDKLKIRIELRVDRAMEYVQMKDMRSSGLEPINVISSYKYQNGLGYYESTKDAATNFFFSYLPKGTYVFEYPLRISHCGNFSNGITSIQCMYAPEFGNHSEGVRLEVKK